MEKKKEVSKRPEQKDTNVETSGSVTGSVTIDGSKTVKVGQDRSVDTGGGFYIGGDIRSGGGDFVGRDQIVYGDQVEGANISAGDRLGTGIGLSGQDLQQLFVPLIQTVQTVPPNVREPAMEKVDALKSEVAKGDKSDDIRIAKLIDGLIDLVPGAVSAVTRIFLNPVLAGLTGPVTKYVLDRIQGT